jgi:hypothetical protein
VVNHYLVAVGEILLHVSYYLVAVVEILWVNYHQFQLMVLQRQLQLKRATTKE